MSGQSSLQGQPITSHAGHHPPDQPNDSTDSGSIRLSGRSNHKIKLESQDDHPVNKGPIVSSAGLPRNSSTSSSSLTTLTSSAGQSSTSSIFRNFQARPLQPHNGPRQDAQQNVHQQQQKNRPTTHPASTSTSSNEPIRPRVQQQHQSTMTHTGSTSTSSNEPIRPRPPPQAAANTSTSDEPPEPPKRRGPGRPRKIRPTSTSEEASLPPSREPSRPRTIYTSRDVSTEAKNTLSDKQYQAAPPQRRAAQAAITNLRLQQDSEDERDSTPEDYDEDFSVPRSYSTSSASILPPESRVATLRAIRDARANKKKDKKKSRASNASSSAVNSTASSTRASTSTLTSPPEITASSNEAQVSSSNSSAQAALKSRKRLRPDIRSATGSNRDEDDPTTVSVDGPMAWHAWSNKDVVAGMRSLYMTCAAAEAAARAAFEATGGEPGRSKLVSNGSSCQRMDCLSTRTCPFSLELRNFVDYNGLGQKFFSWRCVLVNARHDHGTQSNATVAATEERVPTPADSADLETGVQSNQSAPPAASPAPAALLAVPAAAPVALHEPAPGSPYLLQNTETTDPMETPSTQSSIAASKTAGSSMSIDKPSRSDSRPAQKTTLSNGSASSAEASANPKPPVTQQRTTSSSASAPGQPVPVKKTAVRRWADTQGGRMGKKPRLASPAPSVAQTPPVPAVAHARPTAAMAQASPSPPVARVSPMPSIAQAPPVPPVAAEPARQSQSQSQGFKWTVYGTGAATAIVIDDDTPPPSPALVHTSPTMDSKQGIINGSAPKPRDLQASAPQAPRQASIAAAEVPDTSAVSTSNTPVVAARQDVRARQSIAYEAGASLSFSSFSSSVDGPVGSFVGPRSSTPVLAAPKSLPLVDYGSPSPSDLPHGQSDWPDQTQQVPRKRSTPPTTVSAALLSSHVSQGAKKIIQSATNASPAVGSLTKSRPVRQRIPTEKCREGSS